MNRRAQLVRRRVAASIASAHPVTSPGSAVTISTGIRQVSAAAPHRRRALLQIVGVDRARGLVDEAAHRGVDQLFEQALEPRAVDRLDLLRARRRAEPSSQ